MATEKEIQSMLLRLSILLASSLATLSEPVPPSIISDPCSSRNTINNLQAQILNDFCIFLESIQKACTNLSLALRNDKLASKMASNAEDISPISNLDTPSLDAAAAQLNVLYKDLVPKLTWLSRKATLEAKVFKYVAKTEAEIQIEAEERVMIESRGGHIVQLPHSRTEEKLMVIRGKGVGSVWSKSLVAITVEIYDVLGDLCESYMSLKTKKALKLASEARAKAERREGMVISNQDEVLPIQQARQRALKATAMVWKVCDGALNASLAKDNRIAVMRKWKARSEILQDALEELKEAMQEYKASSQDINGRAEKFEDGFDDFMGLQSMVLSSEGMDKAVKVEKLLRAGCRLYVKAGEFGLKVGSHIDYDELDEAGEAFEKVVDILVSTLLYNEGSDERARNESVEDDTGASISEKLDLHNTILAFQQAIHKIISAANQGTSPNEELHEGASQIDLLCQIFA